MKIKNIFRMFFVPCFCIVLSSFNADAFVEKDVAIFNVLDKAAGKTKTITVRVDQAVAFEKLIINVRSCKQTDPFTPENFYAFTEITKSDNTKVFSNWMDRNNPGRDPVQNPDYDVWLLRCE